MPLPTPSDGTPAATQEENKSLVEKQPEKKALSVADEARLSIFGDDDFSEFDAAVEDNIESNDLKISRLSMMQPGSPEIASEVPGYVPGMIVDNVTRQVYSVQEKAPWLTKIPGIDPANIPKSHYVRIVPVAVLPKEYVHWKNRQTEGKGMHFKSIDRNEDRVRAGLWVNRGGTWKPKEGEKNKPPITENLNILCAVINPDWTLASPFVVATFARSNFGAGKFLINSVGRHKLVRLPAWGICYYLYTEKGPNKEYNYFVMKCAPGEKITDNKDYAVNAKQLHEICKEMALKLSDKTPVEGDPENRTQGRMLQELYINSAVMDTDEGDDDAHEDNEAVEGSVDNSAEPTF